MLERRHLELKQTRQPPLASIELLTASRHGKHCIPPPFPLVGRRLVGVHVGRQRRRLADYPAATASGGRTSVGSANGGNVTTSISWLGTRLAERLVRDSIRFAAS